MAYDKRSYGGGAVTTTLSAGIGAADTSIGIAASTGWPDGSGGDFYIVIDPDTSSEEKILIDTRTGTTLAVQTSGRGADGTSATTHSSGATVKHIFVAVDANEANYWVAELAAAATGAGRLLLTDGANSLTAPGLAGTSAQVLVHNGTTWVAVALSGDATISAAGALAIANNKITNAMMADNSVDSAEIVAGAIGTAHIGDDQVTAAKVADGAIDAAAKFGAGVVDAAAIGADQVGTSEAANAVMGKWLFFSRTGTLVTGTGTMPMPILENITILGVRAHVGTAPTGAAVVVDVHLDGTTIFTTQADRPEIAISGTESATEVPAVTSATAGQQFTCDVDQVGSTIAGANLVVALLVVPA